MLDVSMLGGFRLLIDGQRPQTDVGRPIRLLIGFFCTFLGKPHRRERLTEIFWPDLDPSRARAALNTGLWRVRKLLSEGCGEDGARCLLTTGTEVVLVYSSFMSIDVQSFLGRADSASTTLQDHRCGTYAAMDRVEAAVETYTGPFLDGDDGDWVLEQRENLHTRFARVAVDLVRVYGRAGRFEDGIALARRILAFEPHREGTIRDLLVLLVRNGQRAEAIRYFERWRSLLAEDLSLEPLPLTLALAAKIRSSDCLAGPELGADESYAEATY
jgi:DNA-binding SARP family transcriptional activator